MNRKFDIKKELIKCKLRNNVMRTEYKIRDCMRQWGRVYHPKGLIELKRVNEIKEQLLKAIYHLTESETDNLVDLLKGVNVPKEEIVESIVESDNLQLKQIAGIIWFSNLNRKVFPNPLLRCIERYRALRRYKPGGKKRRIELIKQRGNKCEQCGSTTKLQAHHKKGLDYEEDKDLQVLCQKCHIARHNPQLNIQERREKSSILFN